MIIWFVRKWQVLWNEEKAWMGKEQQEWLWTSHFIFLRFLLHLQSKQYLPHRAVVRNHECKYLQCQRDPSGCLRVIVPSSSPSAFSLLLTSFYPHMAHMLWEATTELPKSLTPDLFMTCFLASSFRSLFIELSSEEFPWLPTNLLYVTSLHM